MASLANKVFAITGGASGMGLATGRQLAAAKARAVAIGDYNDQAFDEARKQLKAANPDVEVLTTKLNVADPAQVDAWIEEIVAKFGALDGAVNAAGVAQPVGARQSPTLLAETNEEWNRVIGVNLAGVFYSNRAQIKAMTSLEKRDRSIVNISSMASLLHGGDCYSYGVSKTGVAYLTTCIAKDVKQFGIRVNTISPSATRTPMLAQFFAGTAGAESITSAADTGGFNLVEADDIARTVLWLLSEDASQVFGVNLPVGDTVP
ncbi:hypothetical protein A1O3_07676 [Capronia epimyces CBS 606.96]|uniref:3-oxoacyl-[acyl-carrier protein] reductase n=1 Tax=Capronia epimyces CBS 606.96 TaxID=1182542 RepID=W9XVN6_9EURO|nr:uncharacterized protein A1O3_07676 [Capronia epimyces CBS 606.96]EXJ81385.1 hypothetical protein A1O3_07676 [Capronia epimyces CBS 606.96]